MQVIFQNSEEILLGLFYINKIQDTRSLSLSKLKLKWIKNPNLFLKLRKTSSRQSHRYNTGCMLIISRN